MEKDIDRALDDGKTVTDFRVESQFDGDSRRPTGFETSYKIDGQTEYRYIDNTSRGT